MSDDLLVRSSFPALGTTAVVLTTDPAALSRAVAAVQAEVDAVDRACSRFRDDSELSVLNRSAGRPFAASPLLLEAIAVAQRAATLTTGLVDPTIGGALRVLGYDRDFGEVAADGPAVRAVARRVPGWQAISVDRRAGTVRVPAGVSLDLGATAKALCADRAVAAAAGGGGPGVLVSLGGDVAVAGDPPSGGWPVHVTDDHAAAPGSGGQTISIFSGGLATSGVTVRRWERGGREFHHVLDPSTGLPADTVWRTVSVAAGSCVDANIGSTAAVILGAAAVDWLEARRLPARLVRPGGEVTVIAGWPPAGPATATGPAATAPAATVPATSDRAATEAAAATTAGTARSRC